MNGPICLSDNKHLLVRHNCRHRLPPTKSDSFIRHVSSSFSDARFKSDLSNSHFYETNYRTGEQVYLSRGPDQEPEIIEVRIWNNTVANLTLMALGSSAPEILLSIIEVVGRNFESGDLGPGTIVGSAAFNLLFISAVCILAIPGTETRNIKGMKVFAITTFFSIIAYLWLIVVLVGISKDQVKHSPRSTLGIFIILSSETTSACHNLENAEIKCHHFPVTSFIKNLIIRAACQHNDVIKMKEGHGKL